MPRLLLAIVLVLLAVPAPASAASRTAFGLQITRPAADVPPSQIARELDVVRRAGGRLVRMEASWAEIEPRRGAFDALALARLDTAVQAAARRGLKVLLLFGSAPCWASLAPEGRPCTSYGPRDPADAVGAATMLATRHLGRLAGFQLWNEPDHRNEAYWAGPDKITRYVAMTRVLYPALKRAAPSVPVLAGSFVGTNGRWLQALYAAGFKGTYDVLAVHFYDLTLLGLRETRKVMRAAGDRSPLWLAETGWSSCAPRARRQYGHVCVTRRAQAAQTRSLVRVLRRDRGVQAVLFYSARDTAEFDFGFSDRRGRAKPVVAALRSELAPARPRPVPATRIALRARGGRLRVTGTGPSGDVFLLRATTRRLRYTASVRLDRHGRIAAVLPAQLGTRGVRVSVEHLATGRTGRAAR